MNLKTILSTAILGAAAAGAMGVAGQAIAADASDMQKCYGVVKAGQNDCQTSSSSCAGTARSDNQADAWIYLPKGTCEKIVGAGLAPKA